MTFYIGVVLFIAVMLVFNLVMFVLIIKQITCRPQLKKDDPRKENIKRIQNAISILMLLGLAWLFGFFAIGGAQFIFNLLFLICNSLQGLFIFLIFCVRNQEVQMEWRLIFGQTGGNKVNESSNTRSTGSSSSKNPKGNQNVNSDENTTEKIQMESTSSPWNSQIHCFFHFSAVFHVGYKLVKPYIYIYMKRIYETNIWNHTYETNKRNKGLL